MKPYRLHIFVCQGKRCAAKGSEDVLESLKEKIKAAAIKDVKISKSGCLKVCKETETEGEFSPAVVIYPEGVWYRKVAVSDVDEIIEKHVKKGEVVERLFHYRMTK
ncbi:MAG: (2Fe-2S) ferredoxin domain-containing protein [Deltaproteobacteria bacterium]|nr:(2Fe-2S) ferredoxin domain-containing protein [Deltaproteobacteria bacterium]